MKSLDQLLRRFVPKATFADELAQEDVSLPALFYLQYAQPDLYRRCIDLANGFLDFEGMGGVNIRTRYVKGLAKFISLSGTHRRFIESQEKVLERVVRRKNSFSEFYQEKYRKLAAFEGLDTARRIGQEDFYLWADASEVLHTLFNGGNIIGFYHGCLEDFARSQGPHEREKLNDLLTCEDLFISLDPDGQRFVQELLERYQPSTVCDILRPDLVDASKFYFSLKKMDPRASLALKEAITSSTLGLWVRDQEEKYGEMLELEEEYGSDYRVLAQELGQKRINQIGVQDFRLVAQAWEAADSESVFHFLRGLDFHLESGSAGSWAQHILDQLKEPTIGGGNYREAAAK